MRKTIQILVIIGALGLAACARPTVETSTSQPVALGAPAVLIDSAWSRSTADIEAGTGIVYMTIVNTGDQADTLLAAKTPVASAAEFHIHVQDANGVMRMRMVDGGRIEVPAGGTVVLEPGGLHIMLINLARPLDAGETYPLTLKFALAGEVTLTIPVSDNEPTDAEHMLMIPGNFETPFPEP